MRLRCAAETPEERDGRLRQMCVLQQQRLPAETPEERDARLRQVRAGQQQRLAAETPEERDACLRQVCAGQQQRLAAETPEERDARLRQLRVGQQQRLAAETPEERDARLRQLRVGQQQRLEAETPEERVARLQQVRTCRQQRIAAETPQETAAKRQRDRECHTQQSLHLSSAQPLLHQPAVHCAFPTLFPTGTGDFLGQRQVQVTIGNYFKHLMQYDDGRFAEHPRFRFFALNTEMRHRALQTGRVYVRQHPGDAQLSLDELRDMVGRQGEAFSTRVLHYASSLRGTKQYWQRQRSRLLSMVDTLGLPTVFFTHSAADLQWPELARLICPDNPDSRTARTKAVIENPALADWFFYHRVMQFVKAFYIGVLGATDYWLRFEWQHRGSPHVHGLAWLPGTPEVEQLLDDSSETLKEQIIKHTDQLVSTVNPAVLPDGSNISDAPAPKTNPHICNAAYEDLDEDLADLVATCQRHTRCSAAYCLRTKHGKQECRFGYPKPLQLHTAIVTEDEPTLITARNDGMINSFNPV